MIQEMFPVNASGGTGKGIGPAAAGGFVALLSLFNMGGRFAWSSLSDFIGRKNVYIIYLLLGAILYCIIPTTAHAGRPLLFVVVCSVILSMYGGGFATIPAYLKDLFGSMQVGAIHGRLLTAWSVAGILGPMLVNNLRDYFKLHHATGANLYAPTMYLMAGLLVIGLICNLLVRPVAKRYHFHGNQGAPKPETPRGRPGHPAASH
jgi:MFS family permease